MTNVAPGPVWRGKVICENALLMAIQHRAPPRGLIHHSDRGVQYACGPNRRILDRHGIKASMSRKGDCYDCETIRAVWMA